MATRNEKFINKKLKTLKKSSLIEVVKTDNEYSTDDKALQCCSFKGFKEFIPKLSKNNNNNDNNIINNKQDNRIMKQLFDNTSIYNQYQNMQTDQCTARQGGSLSRRVMIKNDERMYDLAHLLFKISDLLLKITEYEKINCVKETDIRKMLGIVKVDIMRSFLKGKTRHETMNKIILRLIYLDECIKQLCTRNRIGLDSTIKHFNNNNNNNFKMRKFNNKSNKTNTLPLISNKRHTIKMESIEYCNDVDDLTTEESSKFTTFDARSIIPPNNMLRECLNNRQKVNNNNKNYPIIGDNKNSITCFTAMTQNLNSTNTFQRYKSMKNCKLNTDVMIDKCIQTDQAGKTEIGTISIVNAYSAATSYENIYVNPNRSMPNIRTNQLWKQRHEVVLDPIESGQAEQHLELGEIPVQQLNKQISAQKLKESSEANFEPAENNLETGHVLATENGDYQIVSMNILYSKTHVKYIIPNWMQVDFNIDQKPKVLCKQDLEDGMALTSYKADEDGTIHFTLAFSSDELSTVVNGEAATNQLVTKLQDIKDLWAESAKALYDALLKEYHEQNVKVEFTNCPADRKDGSLIDNCPEGRIAPVPSLITNASEFQN